LFNVSGEEDCKCAQFVILVIGFSGAYIET